MIKYNEIITTVIFILFLIKVNRFEQFQSLKYIPSCYETFIYLLENIENFGSNVTCKSFYCCYYYYLKVSNKIIMIFIKFQTSQIP